MMECYECKNPKVIVPKLVEHFKCDSCGCEYVLDPITSIVCLVDNPRKRLEVNKKEIYVNQISPLLKQLAKICNDNDIPYACQFAVKREPVDGEHYMAMSCNNSGSPEIQHVVISMCQVHDYPLTATGIVKSRTVYEKLKRIIELEDGKC